MQRIHSAHHNNDGVVYYLSAYSIFNLRVHCTLIIWQNKCSQYMAHIQKHARTQHTYNIDSVWKTQRDNREFSFNFSIIFGMLSAASYKPH